MEVEILFKVGDLVYYGRNGVCKVTDLIQRQEKESSDIKLYYVLKPLSGSCMITTPADSNKVFMRPLISKEEAEHIINLIPTIKAKAYHCRNLHELSEHYNTYIDTHDCLELVKLTLSLYTKKQDAISQKRKIGTIDERYIKLAEDLLFGELSAATGMSRAFIQERVSAKLREAEVC
jgi:CarD family transcriptional regulator